ncbi:hypothetical protein PG985_003639 [Apiospora marii]|uniref:MYND-type domain-containing protein n=1 Tax=Apiospora marii TaxID=335849 RepID=A0ABR1SIS1_9PEZI
MEGRLQCTICGSAPAEHCTRCRSAPYCSPECQHTDWRTHKRLCSSFWECYTARPSPSHYLVIYFPMVSPASVPQLCWLDTKETTTAGYFEPELDQLLQVPASDHYLGRGMQVVRGNILRGRPKLPDSLRLRYLTEYDGNDAVQVNDTLHVGHSCLCLDGLGKKLWKGPIVAYLKAGNDFDAAKMADMNLTAYRDAIDYLAYSLEAVGSMVDPMSGANGQYGDVRKVKGVRVNCLSDWQSDRDPFGGREFVQVDVPEAHPVFTFEGNDPLEISERFGESWAAYHYEQVRWRREGRAQTAGGRNPNAKMLMRQIPQGHIPQGRLELTTGSILLVNRQKTDLDVRKVRAVCRLLDERVEPLLADGVGAIRKMVLGALKQEELERYM